MSESDEHDARNRRMWIVGLAEERGWNVPGAARMKRALKVLLRGYGLRCVSIREETGDGK